MRESSAQSGRLVACCLVVVVVVIVVARTTPTTTATSSHAVGVKERPVPPLASMPGRPPEPTPVPASVKTSPAPVSRPIVRTEPGPLPALGKVEELPPVVRVMSNTADVAEESAAPSPSPPAALPAAALSPELLPVGCVGCGSGLLSATLGPPPDLPAALGPARQPIGPPSLKTPLEIIGCGCGDGRPCVPGRKACHPCDADTRIGRFFCALYDCICCPDPCYEGRWYPLADAAFFCESVRPITQTKLRWDSGPGFILPDRSEYFWAQANGMGRGPKPPAPLLGFPQLRYNDLVMVTEGGTGAITLATEMSYREVQAEPNFHGAGFGNMALTTKTLLFDCELIQFSMLIRTELPTGNPIKGTGNGHMALEPGGVVGIKLTPTTYMQAQASEWIPLGGDQEYAGSILHYHASINQLVWRIMPDVPLIITIEGVGYSFQTGKYTDPYLGSLVKSSGYSYLYAGGGARLFVCDKIDFGFGGLFALTQQHFSRELYRTEFRVRW